LGTFTDSDFIGGGTDGKGHIVSAGYALSERIALKGTLFFNKRNIDFGTEEDFKRLMLDISFKY
ncbi:MAG: putative porin, partial [Roseibium album]|uniref:putative porin n=1 Tax=Roseibium album TaxID=311410 RepID=UPI0032EF7230